MKRKGSVTVFVSLLLAVILLLFDVMFRSVQISGGRIQIAAGMEEGLYSLFAEYDRELFNTYHLFFLEGGYGTDKMQPGRFYKEVEDTVVKSCYPKENYLGIRGENLWKCYVRSGAITGIILATDNMGNAFRMQAIDYMKDKISMQGIQLLLKETEKQDQLFSELSSVDVEGIEQKARQEYEGEQTEIKEKTEIRKDFVNPIEVIQEIKKKGILSLVLPVGQPLSVKKIQGNTTIGRRENKKGLGIPDDEEKSDLGENSLFQAYVMDHLYSYTDQEEGPLNYQVEYVIGGKMSDEENLKSVVKRLIGIREAANYMYLLQDPESQTQIHQMALTIAAAAGVPALEGVICILLTAAWAFGESLLDVRMLLEEEKVPFVKTRDTWNLALDKLAEIGEIIKGDPKGSEEGMTYNDYLKVLLQFESMENQVERTMDIVEKTIQQVKGKEKFRMDLCVSFLEMRMEVSCGNRPFTIQRAYGYDM